MDFFTRVLLAVSLIVTPLSALSAPDLAAFTLKPKQCVSLHQGQTCYVTVDLQWQTKVKGHYCLYQQPNPSPIQCWQQSQQGAVKKEIATDSDVIFVLNNETTSQVIAENRLTISWVYQKKQKSRLTWRLF